MVTHNRILYEALLSENSSNTCTIKMIDIDINELKDTEEIENQLPAIKEKVGNIFDENSVVLISNLRSRQILAKLFDLKPNNFLFWNPLTNDLKNIEGKDKNLIMLNFELPNNEIGYLINQKWNHIYLFIFL